MTTTTIQALMQTSGVAFGTSGVRGLVAQMSNDICGAYTTAFLNVLQKTFQIKRVALGIDLRPSSPEIATACATAIEMAELQVDYCGALPTPALAYYAQIENIPAIMVTGSHIPFDRNGIKFYRTDGEISKADEIAIVNARVALWADINIVILPEINPQAMTQYEQRYVNFFPPNIFAGLRIGLYEHSSVARDTLKSILEKLGAHVTSLDRTSTFVPIDTEAVAPKDIQRGKDWSAKYGFDAIISTDGDGDRPLISDETGTWLRGDIVGLLTSRYLKIKQIAVPVSCNTAIELCGDFDTVLRTRIGSPYVIEGMQQLNADDGTIAGFEANGGFLMGSGIETQGRKLDALPTRDAVLPALAILAAAQQTGVKISTLLQDLPQRYTASDRLQDFPTAISKHLIDTWSKDLSSFENLLAPHCGKVLSYDLTDGLRVTFAVNEIVHLRPSGNAPELRCYSEAANAVRANELTQMVLSLVKNYQPTSSFNG
ncbi:MAG: phosphomannomutase [Methylococcales bacterium]|nr:phosphomannomutase [Methylococcales bacterium]